MLMQPEKPKVLYTATSDIHIRTFHLPILKRLADGGFSVTLAVEKRSDYRFDCVDDILYLPFKRFPFKIDNFRAFNSLRSLINNQDFDYVHCHTPVVGILTRLAVFFSKTKPIVIYTAHGFHFYKGGSKSVFLIYYPIEWLLSLITDRLITINKEDFNFARNNLKASKVYRIPGMGVDENKFRPSKLVRDEIRKKLGIEQSLVFICIGELNINKNQIFILQTLKYLMSKTSNFKLFLIGTGSQKASLRNYVKSVGLEDYVIFLGWQENVVPYIQAADYGMSASIREGFGIGLVEMLMVGTPIFASRNRGHNEVVNEGENGYLFNLTSPKEFSELLQKHIGERDKFDRVKISKLAKSKFSIEKSVELQYSVYKR